MDEMKVLLKYIHVPQQCSIDVYESNGGYQAIRKALKELQPGQLIDLVKSSGLRGRGGAGFVTGLKWSFVPKDSKEPKYVVCNCDESEPGTFKDRLLIEKDPHQLIEGLMLASYAIGANISFIYCRGEYYEGLEKLQNAVNEAVKKGYLGKNIFGSQYSLEIIVHPGAGAYIAGEETAQLNSLEGYRATPRLKPPFPAVAGLYGKPTVINNVETLCNVVHIMNKGVDWFQSIGTPKSTGTKIFQISGHVQKPGCYEFPIGVTLKTVIEKAGGMLPGRSFKACYPGGSSCALITAKYIDSAMDFETLAGLKSSFGTASIIVMDDTTDMVKVAHRLMEFYQNESCGKCTPCREGTRWVVQILERILKGKGVYKDLHTIKQVSNFMALNSFCPLATGAAPPIVSAIQEFEEEFLTYIRKNPDAEKTPKQLVVYPYV